MSPSQTLLRRLARELRYRPLPALVGRTVVVDAVGVVESSLRTLVVTQGIEPGRWLERNVVGTIAKYDLIDAEFEAAPEALDHPDTRTGIPVLRELGLLPGDGANPLAPEDDLGCFDLIADGIDSGGSALKVFLTSEVRRDRRDPTVMEQMIRLQLPTDYFPRRFVVDDACITNSASVWLGKHFYL
jgi:hypothetical protein